MILQAWDTLPNCLASSSRPALARMIFWSLVMALSSVVASRNRSVRLSPDFFRSLTPGPNERPDAGDFREEPGAGKPPARICEGEAEWPSYSTRTQWTWDSSRGDPKWLVRGGDAARGIVLIARGLSRRQSRSSSATVMPEPAR